jgi:uncharacterized protein YlxW (UPF0749 family)
MKDYYVILGVVPTAEDVVIRAAYKALVQRYHPDRCSGDQTEANAKMAEINEAYGLLSDPVKRKQYDADRGGEEENGGGLSDSFDQTRNETVSPPVNNNSQPNDFTWGLYSKGVWLTVVGAVIALFEPPYGYYAFLHFAFFSVAAYGAYLVGKGRNGLTFLLVLVAFLYNPITSFTLGKDTRTIWIILNMISLAILFYARYALRSGTLEAKKDLEIEQEFFRTVEQEQDALAERLSYLESVRNPSKKEEKQRLREIDQIKESLNKLAEAKSSPVAKILGYIATTIVAAPFVLWYFEDKIKAPWKLDIGAIVGAGLALGAGIALLSFIGAWLYKFYLKSSGGDYLRVRQSLPTGYSVGAVMLGLATFYGYLQLQDTRKDSYNQQIAYQEQMKVQAEARVKAENEAKLERQRAQAEREASRNSNFADPRTKALIAHLENTYPELNPRSAAYNQQVVDSLITKWEGKQYSGIPEYDALRSTFDEYLEQKVLGKNSSGNTVITPWMASQSGYVEKREPSIGVATGSSSGQWVSGDATYTVDTSTVRKKGSRVQMVVKQDSKAGTFSMNVRKEYDCAKVQWRQPDKAVEQLIGGGQWEPVSHNTINATLWEFACGKKLS